MRREDIIVYSQKPFLAKVNFSLRPEEMEKWTDMVSENASYKQEQTSIRMDRAYCKIYQPAHWGGTDLNPFCGRVSQLINLMLERLDMKGNKNFYAMPDAWGLVYEPEESCGPHGHGYDNDFAGVYYLKTTPGCGEIFFPELESEIEPKSGDLVLFGSPVMHGVNPSKTPDATRICVAFNVRHNESV